ncbi:hypothetical protein B4U79_11704 [Dinothrombium tinctorium]|uniref:CHHC U11-48K-type domain-containing protein n=1 Tax=Dinothrombium tinctorium TaxID=1965070 RepID=A0A3S3SCY0_9ACAR|nr:hypothetical protein B4U79_07558 [Dinothrombium tinctorium]RWS12453.1 hypothetical protein B4U79_11704 [Dinothrombium tinctorium]
MAEFKEDFDEGYKKCPFNELHRVAPRRYVNHLNKCPDRNRDDLSTCPYNESHRILKRDWDRHMQECEDKRQFVRNIVEERLQKNKTGKSFVYSTLDEKLRPEFRIERGEDEEKVPMVIPGIQVQMSVDEIVEKVERDQSTPSPYVVQRLQKSQRKYLHHCLVEKAKAKSESLSRSSIASAQSQEEMSSISPTPSLFENTIFVIKNSQYSQTDSSLNNNCRSFDANFEPFFSF